MRFENPLLPQMTEWIGSLQDQMAKIRVEIILDGNVQGYYFIGRKWDIKTLKIQAEQRFVPIFRIHLLRGEENIANSTKLTELMVAKGEKIFMHSFPTPPSPPEPVAPEPAVVESDPIRASEYIRPRNQWDSEYDVRIAMKSTQEIVCNCAAMCFVTCIIVCEPFCCLANAIFIVLGLLFCVAFIIFLIILRFFIY